MGESRCLAHQAAAILALKYYVKGNLFLYKTHLGTTYSIVKIISVSSERSEEASPFGQDQDLHLQIRIVFSSEEETCAETSLKSSLASPLESSLE